VRQRFAAPLDHLKEEGFLRMDTGNLRVNRDGLLQVDRLLHEFFLPQHRGARYS
jgi:oxygen-independent coproporphyrinogen-3 oxidase